MRDDQLLAKVSVRLGPLKPLWLAHCRARGMNCSDAIRQLISKELDNATSDIATTIERQDVHDVACVEIRLGKQELAHARKLSLTEGFRSVNRWIAALTRRRISRGFELGQAEIEALSQSNYQLRALGRNLNQLVKEVRQFKGAVKDYRYASIEQLQDQITAHSEFVHKLLKANSDRWR